MDIVIVEQGNEVLKSRTQCIERFDVDVKLVYIINKVSFEGMWNRLLEDDGPYDTNKSVALWM